MGELSEGFYMGWWHIVLILVVAFWHRIKQLCQWIGGTNA